MSTPTFARTSSGELPDFATRQQVADYTQTSSQTLARWASEGKGPKVIRMGGAGGVIRYKRSDVLAWLDSLRG